MSNGLSVYNGPSSRYGLYGGKFGNVAYIVVLGTQAMEKVWGKIFVTPILKPFS